MAAMVRGLASAFRGTEDPDEEFEELREFGEFERLGGIFMSMLEDESFMEHMTTGFRDAFEAYQVEHVGDDDDDSDADEEFPHIDYDGDLFLPSFEEEFLRRYYDQFPDARASRDAREARRAAAAPAAAAAAPAVAPAAARIAVAAAGPAGDGGARHGARAALALLLQYLLALPPLPATHSEAVRTASLPTPAPLPAPSRNTPPRRPRRTAPAVAEGRRRRGDGGAGLPPSAADSGRPWRAAGGSRAGASLGALPYLVCFLVELPAGAVTPSRAASAGD